MDKVTVIIPCYNSEKYIINAIRSIENQDYNEIDIVCVDDGSTDKTWDVLNNYQKKCKNNIILKRQSNSGVSSARNCGIELATGEYIFFLDSDDEIFPTAISRLVKGMEGGNDISYGTWTSNKGLVTSNKSLDKIVDVKGINEAYMFRKSNLVFASFLYKKEIVDNHSIRFDESLKYGEDNLFLWKYLCFVTKGTEYSTPVYYYNLHDESAVHNISWRITDAIEATLKACEYFKDHNFKYLKAFKEYMPQRTIFYAAKEFAIYGQKDLFDRLIREYNVKTNMHSLYNKNGMALTLSAMLLGNMPQLFYGVMRIYGRKLNKKR